MATLKEKIGYGFGDMSSSMFWKIFSYYLPFFYSNIFGLSLADAGLLMLVTRIWDAVSDPMMESLQTVLIRVGVNTVLICCGLQLLLPLPGFYFLQRPTWGQRVSWYGLMSLTS